MAFPKRLVDRLLAGFLAILFFASLVPTAQVVLRKVGQVGRADVLVSREDDGLRVRAVGPSAETSGLKKGDLLLLVDGREALRAGDPSVWLAGSRADVTLLRDGELRSLKTVPVPAPWDLRYFYEVGVGLAFLFAGASAAIRAGRAPAAAASWVFALFALSAALVLLLTPAPPVDALFRATVLIEDAARALFPALLLVLVLGFPRRAPLPFRLLPLVPAALLLAATARLYLGGGAGPDAEAAVAGLDRLQALWIAAAVAAAVGRLLALSRHPSDLLAQKQIRYMLLGTAVGLAPVVVLDLVPFLLGGSIPLLSAISILPLAVVPFSFLAALTRFRLWDAEVFGREAAAFVGAGLTGAAILALAEVLLSRPFVPSVPYARGAVEVAAGLVLALSFVPVRRGLSAALSRLQYGESWSARGELLGLVRELASPRAAGEIERLLVSRVTRALGLAPAALLPVRPDGRLPADAVDDGEALALDELPAVATRRITRLSRETFAEAPTPAVARLRAAGFRTIAPLAASGRLLGFFAVGDRLGRIPPSHEDLELLETVLAPAALALDHARLFEEVRSQADSYRVLKEFHEDVVAGSAAAIAVTDAARRITSVNPAFAFLAGRPAADLVGRPGAAVLPAALLSDDPPRRIEADLGAGARVLDVAVSAFPGAPRGSGARVFVLHDATDTVRLERALADREKLAALGSLSAGVAHEVNTPLTGVAGFARVLLDETPAEDPRRPLLEKIERQAFRASRLVGSLLDLARGRPRDQALVDPVALARDAARTFEEEVGARGVALCLEVPAAAPAVAGHRDALLQVLVNLLKNGAEAALSARAAGPAAGRPEVRLALGAAGGNVVFRVEDNGPGLPPRGADRLFEPFYTTKTSQGGTGLGLTIARDIIRAHGGSLQAAPRPEGGACFTVLLPPAP